MAHHVAHYNGGGSSTEKSGKYSKNDMDLKKCFVLLSGTSNLHHLGQSHRSLHGYNLASSTIQLEHYHSVPPLERISLSGSYFCSKLLIKVQKEVGGSMVAAMQYC